MGAMASAKGRRWARRQMGGYGGGRTGVGAARAGVAGGGAIVFAVFVVTDIVFLSSFAWAQTP